MHKNAPVFNVSDENGGRVSCAKIRTCLHKKCVRIFEHNFVADKARIRRRAFARQGFLTQSAAKFAEKTCAYACEDRFLYIEIADAIRAGKPSLRNPNNYIITNYALKLLVCRKIVKIAVFGLLAEDRLGVYALALVVVGEC